MDSAASTVCHFTRFSPSPAFCENRLLPLAMPRLLLTYVPGTHVPRGLAGCCSGAREPGQRPCPLLQQHGCCADPCPEPLCEGQPEALSSLSAPALPGGPAAHRDECLFSGTERDSHGAARRDKGPALGDIQQLQGTSVGLSSLGPNSPIMVESSGTGADPRSSPSSFLCVLSCGSGM